MTRRPHRLLVSLVLLALASACSDERAEERTLRRFSDPTEVIDVRAATSFAIELPVEDGERWGVANPPDETVARVVTESERDLPADDDAPAGRSWIVELEAEAEGETTITVTSEPDGAETLTFTIRVD